MTSLKIILTLLDFHFCRLRCQVGRSQLELLLSEALNGLLDVVKAQRDGANQTLYEFLKQLKVVYLDDISTCRTKHKSQRNCHRPQLIAHFDRELKRLDIHPTSQNVEEGGVRQFLDKLRNFVPCALKESRSCTLYSRDSGRLDRFLVLEAIHLTLGLCMVCVKQGKLSASPDSFCAWHHFADVIKRHRGEERGNCEQDLVDHYPFWTWPKRDRWHSYKDFGEPLGAGTALGELLNHNCMSSTRWQHEQ